MSLQIFYRYRSKNLLVIAEGKDFKLSTYLLNFSKSQDSTLSELSPQSVMGFHQVARTNQCIPFGEL